MDLYLKKNKKSEVGNLHVVVWMGSLMTVLDLEDSLRTKNRGLGLENAGLEPIPGV